MHRSPKEPCHTSHRLGWLRWWQSTGLRGYAGYVGNAGYAGYAGYAATRGRLFSIYFMPFSWMVSLWRVVLALLQHLRRMTLQTCATTCCDMLQYNNTVTYDSWLREDKGQHMFDDSNLLPNSLVQKQVPRRSCPDTPWLHLVWLPIWWRNVNDFGAVVETESRDKLK